MRGRGTEVTGQLKVPVAGDAASAVVIYPSR
jgi:hypothetical protein